MNNRIRYIVKFPCLLYYRRYFVEASGSNWIKQEFFKDETMSVLLYGCSVRTLLKNSEKKLDENYKRILRAILNKNPEVAPSKTAAVRPLISHLINQPRRRGYARLYCWIRDELMSDVLLQTTTHRHTSVGRQAKTNIRQLCADTWRWLEDQPRWTIGTDGKKE